MRWPPAAASLLLVAVLGAPGPAAAATPEQDFQAVKADWQPDRDVTACRFTRAQLVNAHNVASSSPDFDNYEPGFRAEVRAEIARHDAGGCKAATVKTVKPAPNLTIVKVRARRGLKESVTVKNLGKRTAKLRGVRLRDRSGGRIKLGRARLGPGKSLRVFTGCAKGKKRFIRLKSRVFACRKKTVWNDRGDVVRLVAANGTLLSRVGYGRFRSVQRF